MRAQIIEGILIAWVLIKLCGPAAERELAGYQNWMKQHPRIGPLMILFAFVVYAALWNLWK